MASETFPHAPAHRYVSKLEGCDEQAEFFMKLPELPGVDAEKKFKDIDGVVLDVSQHGRGGLGRPLESSVVQRRTRRES